MGIQANWFPSVPQDCTFLGQCKHPIALWTLPSDFIRFVFPCFSLFTIIFIYICPGVIFLLSARATNRLSLSREQGIRSGQHPARSVPSCFTRSPEPPWNSLPKDVQLPLRPPALLAFALAWEEALLCFVTVSRDGGGCAGSAHPGPVTALSSRAHLRGCCHAQQVPGVMLGMAYGLLWQIFLPTDFPSQRPPLGAFYHHKIELTGIESEPLFISKQQ